MNDNISIYKTAEDNQGVVVPAAGVLEGILKGRWKEAVERLRGLTGKDYDEHKKTLPGATFSGTFTRRSKDPECVVTYTGIVCLDFDDLEAPEEEKVSLTASPYLVCAFLSPGGKGLKALVRVDSTLEYHSYAWQRLYWYFLKRFDLKADPSGKDVSRLCFVSYDPSMRYNEKAKVFQVSKKQRQRITDERKLFEIAKKWTERHYTFSEGHRNNYVNLLAFHLNHLGLSQASSETLIFSDIGGIDGKLTVEYQKTIASAFSKPSQGTILYEQVVQENFSQNPVEDDILKNTMDLLHNRVAVNTITDLMKARMHYLTPEGETPDEHGMGVKWLHKTMNRAHQMLVERQRAKVGTKRLSTVEDAIGGIINATTGKTVPSCIPEFDMLLEGGFMKGSFYGLIGQEGTGKSIYALLLACESAKRGIPVVYWNAEMSNLQMYGRIAKKELSINLRKEIENKVLSDQRMAWIKAELQKRLTANLYVVSEMNFSASDITDQIRSVREIHGKEVGLVIVDGIGHMEDVRNDEIQSTIENTRLLKECAKENGVVVIGLLHTTTGIDKHFRNIHLHARGGMKTRSNMDGMIAASLNIDMARTNTGTGDVQYLENCFYLRLVDKRESGKQCDKIIKTEDPLKIIVSTDPPSMYDVVLNSARR